MSVEKPSHGQAGKLSSGGQAGDSGWVCGGCPRRGCWLWPAGQGRRGVEADRCLGAGPAIQASFLGIVLG